MIRVKSFQGRVILNVKNTTDQNIHVTMNGKSISGSCLEGPRTW